MAEDDSYPMDLHWSGLTHPGRFRPNNEDAFLALTFDAREVRFLGKTGVSSLGEGDFVFAVSDGMGGANAGEFASRVAVDKITKLLPRTYRMAAAHISSGIGDVLLEIFSHVHAEIEKLGRTYAECAGMGATLSLACFSPGWMHFAHIGDSRIYYLPKDGGLRQVSHDHSYVGWLRRQGKLNEREARTHPRKNVLNQALGAGHQVMEPQIGAVDCQAGDRFLLCTDGVNDGLWDQRLEEYLKSPGEEKSRAARIVERAVAESGRDNCTAVVVEFPGE
ncbi:MAG TPA: protein phosphatase 2C domain-containing protein [Verrucomicrobiales bacterium]|nr:protein phosphatase 2C domain-containing protein [Verrucomicrobiales bacterium]